MEIKAFGRIISFNSPETHRKNVSSSVGNPNNGKRRNIPRNGSYNYADIQSLFQDTRMNMGPFVKLTKEMIAGGIGADFPQGDTGAPFWFSNIGGNHFPREGFTYKPWDSPDIKFSTQLKGILNDGEIEDMLKNLASKAIGTGVTVKSKNKNITEMIEKQLYDINANYFGWLAVKEMIAFGMSFWKPRMPVMYCNSLEHYLHLPVSNLIRIWWTPDRIPIFYEFRGADYNGYFKPDELVTFTWNEINAQVIGTGIMPFLTRTVDFEEFTANGVRTHERSSLLDMKHSTQDTFFQTLKKYMPRFFLNLPDVTVETADQVAEDMANIDPTQDIITKLQGATIQELNSNGSSLDPKGYNELISGEIQKTVGTSKNQISSSSSSSRGSAVEQAKLEEDLTYSRLPEYFARQLAEKVIKPWYMANSYRGDDMYDGMIHVPWHAADIRLSCGKEAVGKLEHEHERDWLEMLVLNGEMEPGELRKIIMMKDIQGLTTEITPEQVIKNLDRMAERGQRIGSQGGMAKTGNADKDSGNQPNMNKKGNRNQTEA